MSTYSSKAKVLERAKLEREKRKMVQEKRKNVNVNNISDADDIDYLKTFKMELLEIKKKEQQG